MSRIARLIFSVFLASVLLLATAGASSARDEGGATYMKVKGAHAKPGGGGGSLLFSHGGSVETVPKVFIVYWGPQ